MCSLRADFYAKLPELIGERLVLRPLARDMAAELAAAVNYPEIFEWLTALPNPYEVSHAIEFIERSLNEPYARWAICIEDRVHGCLGLEPELGYWLRPHLWGQGVMTDAATLALEHEFGRAPDQEIVAAYRLGNHGSAAVLGKLGFIPRDIEMRFVKSLAKDMKFQAMSLSRADFGAACLRRKP